MVTKQGGDYSFAGPVVAAFHKASGADRYVVEDDRGILHIFGPSNLVLAPLQPTGEPATAQPPILDIYRRVWDRLSDAQRQGTLHAMRTWSPREFEALDAELKSREGVRTENPFMVTSMVWAGGMPPTVTGPIHKIVCQAGCTYSRGINQPVPRLCTHCGKPEGTKA